MSQTLVNAHIAYGRPCGIHAGLDELEEWAGKTLLDHLEQKRIDSEIFNSIYEDIKRGVTCDDEEKSK